MAKKSNPKPTAPSEGEKFELERSRSSITMPTWLQEEALLYGAKRGYGMSELVSRLLEKFVDEEKARLKITEGMSEQAKGTLKPT